MPSGERMVTGTMLRDLEVCERRAWHDVHSPARARDPVSSFVALLWAGGLRYEREVLDALVGAVDLRGADSGDRRRMTIEALGRDDAEHVLGAEIAHGDLLGRPDLISRIDGRWVAGDVRAGTPFAPDGRRVKPEYGIQIGLYARILGLAALGDAHRAFVIGSDGTRVVFGLGEETDSATIAGMVADRVVGARAILAGEGETRGEASARCGLCHWRSLCRGELEAADDLTLIAELGRKVRGGVERVAATRSELANLDVRSVAMPGGRTTVPGLGSERLSRFRDRARQQVAPGTGPYARRPLGLVRAPLEWHLDIEADPTRDGHVYLHGVWERRIASDGEACRFVHFFADGDDGERDAFADAWAFLTSDPTARIYYYSRYERTSYRALQRRHPGVCSSEQVERLFSDSRVVDLYSDVVRPHTEWPLSSYGIKPIAKSCGFSWAAEDASGASSIAWYDEWVRSGDPALRERIVDYNRSDCIASAVVLDALIALPVGAPIWPPIAGADRGGGDRPIGTGGAA